MLEKEFLIENINLLDFYGVNDSNLEFIKQLNPRFKIIARGNSVKVMGAAEELKVFELRFHTLLATAERIGRITRDDIVQVFEKEDIDFEANAGIDEPDLILHGRSGKVIKARTLNQQKLVEAITTNDMVFAIGPAGTGKTYTAVALAVKALKGQQVKRIILTRPAVEAGENLGFLPGDLRDKLDPYLQPLYDALRDMLPHQKLMSYLEDGTIEIAPLAFMRGRTLDNAFVILDEAQNATISQMKMFLTRMGRNARFILTGDITQIDLPRNQKSGLMHAYSILRETQGISFILLDERDIIRHKLVTRIIKAYESNGPADYFGKNGNDAGLNKENQ